MTAAGGAVEAAAAARCHVNSLPSCCLHDVTGTSLIEVLGGRRAAGSSGLCCATGLTSRQLQECRRQRCSLYLLP